MFQIENQRTPAEFPRESVPNASLFRGLVARRYGVHGAMPSANLGDDADMTGVSVGSLPRRTGESRGFRRIGKMS